VKGTDRFLIAVVAGTLVLVGAVLALVLARSGPNRYRTDDSPEAVVQNYLLACQNGDMARAQGTLSPDLPGYPASTEAFESDLRTSYWTGNGASAMLTMLSSTVRGERATLRVRETVFYSTGPLDRGDYGSEYGITLRRHAGGWRILAVDGYPSALCWAGCWQAPEGCP
jgi:hypothetical protein